MKLLLPLFFSATPVMAQIYADVSTTLGDFSIELYHEDSPKAVANLITLAEGTRPWINSTTGAVHRNTPYYDGIIFHRVIDGFMNQAGSPNGMGNDGPGYNFPDEVDNGVLHDEPYLLSAANSGPNTNGSQFFTTVDATPWLDGIHTVYGKIVTGTDTIDLINKTPVSGSTPVTPVVINSMTIRRVGAEAEAFDEFAQALPIVSEAVVSVTPPTESETAKLVFQQPAGSTLQVSSSTDLGIWSQSERYIDAGSSSIGEFLTEGALQKEFFHPSLVTWPAEAVFPDSLMGKTITMPIVAGGTESWMFELELTEPGSLTLTRPGLDDIVAVIDYEESTFEYDGYGASFLIYTSGLVPVRFRMGGDLPISSPEVGRVTGTFFTANPFSYSGTFAVEP